MLAVPFGKEAVVMLNGGAKIMIDRFAVAVWCVGLEESITVSAAVLDPVAVGVPLIAPVNALIVRPAGRPVADHV